MEKVLDYPMYRIMVMPEQHNAIVKPPCAACKKVCGAAMFVFDGIKNKKHTIVCSHDCAQRVITEYKIVNFEGKHA